MALDTTTPANERRDTQSDLTPYTVPKLVWQLVEPYLTKYQVAFSGAYPKARVTDPTIVYRLLRRIPGIDDNPNRNKRGPNYTRDVKQDGDGNIHQEFTQYFTIWYEFAIFGVSPAQADELAWDFETAVLDVMGRIEATFPGFKMVFSYQSPDASMSWRQQDELAYRSIVLEAAVPIRYLRISPAVRGIIHEYRIGRTRKYERVTRTAATTYTPTTEDNEIVNAINFIFINRNNQRKCLRQGTDFFVRTTDQETLYLEWEDTYGMTPAVGEEFVVDYDVIRRFGVQSYTRDPGYPG